jgi:outer membrane protein
MKHYLILAFLLGSFPILSQIEFNSLQEVLAYADAKAITIQGARINEQIAIAGKKEAKSNLLPSLGASLGYNDNITLQPTLVPAQLFNPGATEETFEELTFGTKYLYSFGIQAQWDILNFQKVFAVETANLEADKSKINSEVSRYKTYNQLASIYYSILLTQESIQVYEENVRVAESIFVHAREKYQEGIINEAELNQAGIKKLQNQRSLNLAKNNLDQFYLQLQSQLNTRERITVTDTPENFVLRSALIQSTHPEVILQEAEVIKQESILKQTKALRLPSLSLNYQNNTNWATNDFMGFADANTLPQQIFGVKISLSGLLSGTTKQKINQSKWTLQLQQLQLDNTKLVKQKEDELMQLELQQTSNQLAEYKQILELQEKNDAHAANRYESGMISLDQRLDKYDDLLAVQNSYLQSLAEYTLAQYKIYIRQMNFKTK